jgi:hypothetical protein
MNPAKPSSNRVIYRTLRTKCGLTHHQVRHLFKHKLGGLTPVKHILYDEFKQDKKIWVEPAEAVAILSMRPRPREAGIQIVKQCWPDKESGGEPDLPYTVATLAARMVVQASSFNKGDKRKFWGEVEKLLRYEEAQAERAWNERLLSSYLKMLRLI